MAGNGDQQTDLLQQEKGRHAMTDLMLVFPYRAGSPGRTRQRISMTVHARHDLAHYGHINGLGLMSLNEQQARACADHDVPLHRRRYSLTV